MKTEGCDSRIENDDSKLFPDIVLLFYEHNSVSFT